MFDNYLIGIGGTVILVCSVVLMVWLNKHKQYSFIGLVIAIDLFIIRSCILRVGNAPNASVLDTAGIEENQHSIDWVSEQFDWTLVLILIAFGWVMVDICKELVADFIVKHYNFVPKFTDNNEKPKLGLVPLSAEERAERKRA